MLHATFRVYLYSIETSDPAAMELENRWDEIATPPEETKGAQIEIGIRCFCFCFLPQSRS